MSLEVPQCSGSRRFWGEGNGEWVEQPNWAISLLSFISVDLGGELISILNNSNLFT